MTIRVAIVDDQELVRAGLEMVISASPDMEVVAQAEDGRGALALQPGAVDVVLMDIKMPVMDGVEASVELMAGDHPPRIIALTTFDVDDYAVAALRAGASGFLLKDASGAEVLHAIRAVHVGDTVFASTTITRLFARLDAPVAPGSPTHLDRLTSRERDVLVALAGGMSNAEIARNLYLTEATVKTHLRHVMGKLEVRDRLQAVVYAYEHGLQPRP